MAKRGAKEFFKSKTFWFGALWVVVGIANLFGFADFQPDTITNDITEIVSGLIIIVLRFKTTQPVKIK